MASNSSQPFKYTDPESKPHRDTVDVVGTKPRPRPVKPAVRPDDEIEILPSSDPVPSTSKAIASCSYNGARPKRRVPKLSQPPKKPRYSRPQVKNVSPPDNSLAPELVLEILDTERFSDVEVLSKSSGSSDQICVIPSPTYRLNATSDVSTEPVTQRYSPVYKSLSDYEGEYPSPNYGPLAPNPLADSCWSDSD